MFPNNLVSYELESCTLCGKPSLHKHQYEHTFGWLTGETDPKEKRKIEEQILITNND